MKEEKKVSENIESQQDTKKEETQSQEEKVIEQKENNQEIKKEIEGENGKSEEKVKESKENKEKIEKKQEKKKEEKSIPLKFVIVISAVLFIIAFLLSIFIVKQFFLKEETRVSIVKTQKETPQKEKTSFQKEITLFYSKDNYYLEKTYLKVKLPQKEKEKYKEIIRIFLKGPYDKKYKKFYNANIEIKSIFVQDNIIILNFAKDFAELFKGHSLNETTLHLYSLVNSILINLPQIDGVQILIEGEPVNLLNNWIDISNPLVLNPYLIK